MSTIISGKGRDALVALDTFLSPTTAFNAIRTAPTWLFALVVTVVAVAAASWTVGPAVQHAEAAQWPQWIASHPEVARASASAQRSALAVLQRTAGYGWIVAPIFIPLACAGQAAILFFGGRLFRGRGSYLKIWAACCNIALVTNALGTLFQAAVVGLRGASSFDTLQSVQEAVPGLAWLSASANPHLHAFLANFTIFSIWGAVLYAIALKTIAHLPSRYAIAVALAPLLLLALVSAVMSS